jgi:DNA-directed RNA polymerase specialized sigma24 family protein
MNDELQSGRELHEQLLDGDITATARIAEAYFEEVRIRLEKNHASEHNDLVSSAVQDAFINYFSRPEQYQPDRLSLASYLYMSANGDFLNLLKQEKRYVEGIDESVELDADDAEYQTEATDHEVENYIHTRESVIWLKIKEILPSPSDQKLVELLLDGVRETEPYATILGITDRPTKEQRNIVKRHKDRLKKQLQRNIDPSELRNV